QGRGCPAAPVTLGSAVPAPETAPKNQEQRSHCTCHDQRQSRRSRGRVRRTSSRLLLLNGLPVGDTLLFSSLSSNVRSCRDDPHRLVPLRSGKQRPVRLPRDGFPLQLSGKRDSSRPSLQSSEHILVRSVIQVHLGVSANCDQ